MRSAILTSLFCLAAAAPAWAGVSLTAGCADETVTIMIEIYAFAPADDWIGFVVQRTLLGDCAGPVTITPAPLSFGKPRDKTLHQIQEPVPWPGRTFRYEARAIDRDGVLHDLPATLEPPWDHVSCGEAVASRGFLGLEGDQARLEPCPGTCWPPLLLCGESASLLGLLGIPVDVIGEFHHSDMPIPCDLEWERIEPTHDGGCGPTPVAPRTWGEIKGRYR
jgi:hypothetical protein